jgi:hypothetical protein
MYDPPNTHYAHLDVVEYEPDDIFDFMGPRGKRFYKLTSELGVRYIWFNRERKYIEVWGSYESLKKHDPVSHIRSELNKFVYEKHMGADHLGHDNSCNHVPPVSASSSICYADEWCCT